MIPSSSLLLGLMIVKVIALTESLGSSYSSVLNANVDHSKYCSRDVEDGQHTSSRVQYISYGQRTTELQLTYN